MKRTKLIAASLSLLLVFGSALTGCTAQEYELSYYGGEDKDSSGRTVYNTQLFYVNYKQQGYPDPDVLDDTARSGYYYLYGTSGSFTTMRSKDLVNWEDVGPTFLQRQSDAVRRATSSNLWAPEVVYDEDTELYYLFFSATPEADGTYTDANAKQGIVRNSHMYNMYVATSESPEGPFTMVDFGLEENCHEFEQADGSVKGRVHNGYNTEAGHVLDMTAEDEFTGKYAYVYSREDGLYYEAAFPHYYARYCLFAPDELYKFNDRMGIMQSGDDADKVGLVWNAGYFGNIDPHPFVDPVTGEKYLYCNMSRPTAIMVVHMFDWLTPDWENAAICTAGNYYTVEDWEKGVNRGVSYEATSCNEGPHVLYHEDANGKGLYYLTFSVNDYGTSAYQVAIAISESPMGPFRKLTEEEGGLLLCSSTTESQTISGAGHHSFATLGDQLYIVYHRHRDYDIAGADRYTAADEMKWITVKDKDGNDMEVPYVNGPTDSLQPLPEAVSGYKNVAEGMEVTCTDASAEAAYVTDGLLSVHKTANDVYMSYVRETYISETATFTLDFDAATTIRAIMVYNSAFERSMFYNIPKIELTLADGSKRVMHDLAFDIGEYCQVGGADGDRVIYLMSGSALFTEFYDIEVTSVSITVEVPEDQESVGISEIRILGK